MLSSSSVIYLRGLSKHMPRTISVKFNVHTVVWLQIKLSKVDVHDSIMTLVVECCVMQHLGVFLVC